jgi:hypothetical protein
MNNTLILFESLQLSLYFLKSYVIHLGFDTPGINCLNEPESFTVLLRGSYT